ncbi:hypothetical protein AXA84_0094 [Candidatus Phytoplasma oryzae]|uniref:Uncharacterized protein n=1 Tax=Candidatus Phytoplasma oryzae TaxID=203274 RepID=A0A139JR62_9MOLU|nr:hypothetical protein [Candidatus Phytoplasma oryzae]KXT29449.1 hypothetical protein AXA84_0094 [Candidatus Phytoplasma oryzae]RAM58029.1 hypothetical protein DH96_00535 [Candidatus Phytoplasma oryzae]
MFLIKKEKIKRIIVVVNLLIVMVNFFLLNNKKVIAMNVDNNESTASSSYSDELVLNVYDKATFSSHTNNVFGYKPDDQSFYEDLKIINKKMLNKTLNINSIEEFKNKYNTIRISFFLYLTFNQYYNYILGSNLNPYPHYKKICSETHEVAVSDLKTEIIDGFLQLNLPDVIEDKQKERKILNYIYDFQRGEEISSEIDARINAKNLFMILLDSLNIKEVQNDRGKKQIFLGCKLETFSFVENTCYAFKFDFRLEGISFR